MSEEGRQVNGTITGTPQGGIATPQRKSVAVQALEEFLHRAHGDSQPR